MNIFRFSTDSEVPTRMRGRVEQAAVAVRAERAVEERRAQAVVRDDHGRLGRHHSAIIMMDIFWSFRRT